MKKWIQELLEKHQLQVIESAILNQEGFLLSGIIFLREDLSQERKEFIVLHEIGHMALHQGWFHQGYNKKKEMEANLFAADQIIKNSDEDLEELNIIEFLNRNGVPCTIAERLYYDGHLRKIESDEWTKSKEIEMNYRVSQ